MPHLIALRKVRKHRFIQEAMRIRKQSNAHAP
jgi:hypothetical protein